jgi:hypothetical protein
VAIDACLMIEGKAGVLVKVHAHAKPLARTVSDDVPVKGLVVTDPVIQGAQRTPYTL